MSALTVSDPVIKEPRDRHCRELDPVTFDDEPISKEN